jgi:hypothetical protein
MTTAICHVQSFETQAKENSNFEKFLEKIIFNENSELSNTAKNIYYSLYQEIN